MYQFYKQFQAPRAEDYEENINTLNMEVAQLRRENLFLRKKLERVKPKEQPKKAIRSRNSIDDAPAEPPAHPDETPLVWLLKELAVVKEHLRLIFPSSTILKGIRPVNWRQTQRSVDDSFLKGLEQVRSCSQEDRFGALLGLVEEYHKQSKEYETHLEDTLSEAADYVRRINQVLLARMTSIKRSHDLVVHKAAVLRLLHEQAKQEIGQSLKEMKRMLDRQGEQWARLNAPKIVQPPGGQAS